MLVLCLATLAAGAVVENVRDLPREAADLRTGDVIVAWSRGNRHEPILSPFDLREVALEQLPRGTITLEVVRGGEMARVDVRAPAWPVDIDVRPVFPPSALAMYEQGRASVAEKKVEEGMRGWREAASRLADPAARVWLLGRVGSTWAGARRQLDAAAAYDEAADLADAIAPHVAAAVREDQARRAHQQAWHGMAEKAFQAALERREQTSATVAAAYVRRSLGEFRYLQGHGDQALELYEQVLTVLEREVPESLVLAQTLADKGFCLAVKGELEEAERVLVRAERLSSSVGVGTRTHLFALRCLGGTFSGRGDFVTAERLWRRDLELSPTEYERSVARLNLGTLAYRKGDLDGAEALARPALAVAEQGGGRPAEIKLLALLGNIARARGDLGAAEDLLRRALVKIEATTTDPYALVGALVSLGRVRLALSDRAGAKTYFERALAENERAGVAGLDPVNELAALARGERDWAAAEALYGRAMPYVQRSGTLGPDAARLFHGLGDVERGRGHLETASALFTQAVEAVEALRDRVGASDEARSLFASRFFGIYQDHMELLVSMGRTADAYHVLEKSRARSLLALLAERDLMLDDGVPPALERERRVAASAYQRMHDNLLRLDPSKNEERRVLTLKLAELRDQQARIADRIREASPRIAELRYPAPLNAVQVQAHLEPGTVLLAYSVGEERTLLFVLDGRSVEAVVVRVGEVALRETVERLRDLMEQTVPPSELEAEARAAYDRFVRPVEHRLDGAQRLIISPDGFLHALPFAALRRGDRFLAEWKPVSIVPSGTIQARWAQSRASDWPRSELVAFADPRRPPTGLNRLPESRLEVEVLRKRFRNGASYFGDAATAERARQGARGARYVHFACHALVNERLPLDSGLALHADGDDGLLQAWEIYESVRLDADLVTLSACQSASGAARPGEGLLGLTRAFQYAGARAVLASLWDVGDTSSRWFMSRFYAQLARGVEKGEALRRTQQASIRAGHHPIRWAAYQLYGDAR